MTTADRWLLPDGVDEVLPPEALKLEKARRQLLDLYGSWGYDYVIPPIVEFLESLLTGTGQDLDHKTFKLTDQLSGRLMGVRADITPQVARMDAHSLNREGPVRLCYAGTVLHARSDTPTASRSPIRVGAELFGVPGIEGEFEIICLMIESLLSTGMQKIHLELGDVGVFRLLLEDIDLSPGFEVDLFEHIQRKATADLKKALKESTIDKHISELISQLPGLMGGEEVLETAMGLFKDHEPILERLNVLRKLSQKISSRFDELEIFYDLSELRGYSYHTGIVFAAYDNEDGQLVSRGGRYDHIGEVFGRARVATGFDIDLKMLAQRTPLVKSAERVHVDSLEGDRDQLLAIRELRRDGYVVVEGEKGLEQAHHRLVLVKGKWKLVPGD